MAGVGRHRQGLTKVLRGTVGVARGQQVSGCVVGIGGCQGESRDDRAQPPSTLLAALILFPFFVYVVVV